MNFLLNGEIEKKNHFNKRIKRMSTIYIYIYIYTYIYIYIIKFDWMIKLKTNKNYTKDWRKI
jgi:hypothetical protein